MPRKYCRVRCYLRAKETVPLVRILLAPSTQPKQIELILKFGVIFEFVAVRSMARSSRGITELLLRLIRKLSAPQL